MTARPRSFRSRTAWLGAVAVALLLLAACAPPPPNRAASKSSASEAVPTEIRVTGSEFKLDPGKLELRVAGPVTFVFENAGRVDHDLTSAALGLHLVAKPGQTARQTVNVQKAGTFDLECSLSGHKEAGMKGSLAVTLAKTGAAASQPAASPAPIDHSSHGTLVAAETRGNQPLKSRVENGVRIFDVRAQHVNWQVLPGETVEAYTYEGQLPGPVIRATEGELVRVNVTNELPEPTVVHFHGPFLPNSMDGVPGVTQDPIAVGGTFSYEFKAVPAGIYTYHTHHNSAVQEPMGLYGVFIVDPKVQTTQYDHDVLQVVSEHSGYFLINGKSFPETEPIVVKKDDRMRLRLVNMGQTSHPMHLHGHSFRIVATDGRPVTGDPLVKDTINISPGERYDLEFVADNPGTWVFHCHLLSHVTNKGVEPGGMITVIKIEE